MALIELILSIIHSTLQLFEVTVVCIPTQEDLPRWKNINNEETTCLRFATLFILCIHVSKREMYIKPVKVQ